MRYPIQKYHFKSVFTALIIALLFCFRESRVIMRVDIWSDIVCPFCYIGKKRLEAAAEQAGVELESTGIVLNLILMHLKFKVSRIRNVLRKNMHAV